MFWPPKCLAWTPSKGSSTFNNINIYMYIQLHFKKRLANFPNFVYRVSVPCSICYYVLIFIYQWKYNTTSPSPTYFGCICTSISLKVVGFNCKWRRLHDRKELPLHTAEFHTLKAMGLTWCSKFMVQYIHFFQQKRHK